MILLLIVVNLALKQDVILSTMPIAQMAKGITYFESRICLQQCHVLTLCIFDILSIMIIKKNDFLKIF